VYELEHFSIFLILSKSLLKSPFLSFFLSTTSYLYQQLIQMVSPLHPYYSLLHMSENG
jgi:hypothetical protein